MKVTSQGSGLTLQIHAKECIQVATFPAFEKKIVLGRDVFQRLMGAQKKLSLPSRKINPKL
jgi:hypothetical protein